MGFTLRKLYIIDEDEVNTGIRREAGYYGLNAFFLRLTIIVVFICIIPMFIIADWEVFDIPVSPEIQLTSHFNVCISRSGIDNRNFINL